MPQINNIFNAYLAKIKKISKIYRKNLLIFTDQTKKYPTT